MKFQKVIFQKQINQIKFYIQLFIDVQIKILNISLKCLNLSNFNSNNITNMSDMFFRIKKNCNLICNDEIILNNFN